MIDSVSKCSDISLSKRIQNVACGYHIYTWYGAGVPTNEFHSYQLTF